MKKLFLFAITLASLACTGCSKSDGAGVPAEKVSPIVRTDLPASVNTLDPIEFNVYHLVYNGCGRFDKAVTQREGNTITIKFLAVYEGEACTMDIPTRTTPYTFVPKAKGTYTFRFRSGSQDQAEYLVQKLEVR